MNAVEIETAVSELVLQSFDNAKFPFAFLLAFGNKATTIKKLQSGVSNKSDLGDALRQWFLVPLPVIDEAVEHIRDGSIMDVIYDAKAARLVEF